MKRYGVTVAVLSASIFIVMIFSGLLSNKPAEIKHSQCYIDGTCGEDKYGSPVNYPKPEFTYDPLGGSCDPRHSISLDQRIARILAGNEPDPCADK